MHMFKNCKLLRVYTKTDLVFGFTRPRQNEYRAGERLTGRAGWKPNPGEGIPGQKTPRTLLAPFFLGFYPKTIMR